MAANDDAVRRSLVELHRELLDEQRKDAERIGGRMTASETLQAATEDLRVQLADDHREPHHRAGRGARRGRRSPARGHAGSRA
jgi:hypothetical protein